MKTGGANERKKDWRQLEDKFWFRRFFVRYHKKTKQDMPDTLTLCYWGQTLIKAISKWFVYERLFWIFSPLFFALLALWLIATLVGAESLVGAVTFMVVFMSSFIFLIAEVFYWSERLEGTKLGKWFGIVFTIIGVIMALAIISAMVYYICTNPEEVLAELPGYGIAFGMVFGIIIGAGVVLIGVGILINKFIFKSHTWRRMVEFLKTFKEKHLCPIIFYPTGFKPLKFKPTKQKSN